MQHTTKEIRDGLLDMIAATDHLGDKRTLRAAINHINQMAADLRRAGWIEYDRTSGDDND